MIEKILSAIVKDPKIVAAWRTPIEVACARFGITTPKCAAAFVAQMAHESGNFSRMSENLNYSAEALRAKFGKYFTTAAAEKYGRTASHSADWVGIASILYGNRMGNGPVETMEGWKYRGRGPGQLTGKSNYQRCGKALGVDLVANPDLVAQPATGALAFAWFWNEGNSTGKSLNRFAEVGDIDAISDIVNLGHETKAEGDALGFKDRLALTNLGMGAVV
jgi:putative chitinase